MVKLLSILTMTLMAFASAAGGERETAAESAALDWLTYLDAGEYLTSWTNAGVQFKAQLTPQAWEDAASGARVPLGALRSRTLRTAQYANSLPGAPDGEYVVLGFDSSFDNKVVSVETVTTVLENGEWRVIGYFIR
ncbi:MAG: DUF4019 domain-containing protein [Gammaproteobacteria bacterium]|nr:DUF4019 domain-containing protein [Gammaproteobacteria bacterium]